MRWLERLAVKLKNNRSLALPQVFQTISVGTCLASNPATSKKMVDLSYFHMKKIHVAHPNSHGALMNMQNHPIRVLLVDGDEDDYIVVRDLLSNISSTEFILMWVSDYGAALDSILASEFDVCLLDYRLKERNGLELMQEAIGHGCDMPIIFLTGQGHSDLDLEAISKGAADWLTKGELSATLLERSFRLAMERQRRRSEQIKAGRVIQALSECNHAVIHIEDEVELLRSICRIVVDVGGYRMAWVGYAEDDPDKTVTPVAKYGYEKEYLETVKVTWEDGEKGKGPAGACIRTGLPSVIRSVGTQAEFAPWKVEASKLGYASVIGLPLLLDGRKLGALTIYSSETDAFDTEEVEFLVKLSSNLSYGVGVLRLRKAQMQAEEFLKESNRELEGRVEERTAELLKINVELRREVEERRQAEEEVREKDNKYRTLFETANDGIFLQDTTGFVDCNQKGASMYGLRREDVIAHSPAEFSPERQSDGRLSSELAAEKILAAFNGEPQAFEWQSLRADGVPLDVDITLNRVEVGGSVLLQAIVRDITERKRAEEALRENQSRLDLALRSAHMGVWQWDLIKDRRFFDDQVCRLLGIDPAKFTGTADDFFNAVHPDDREVLKAALAKTIRQDVPYESEYRGVWPDGSVHYIIARAKLFRDETGQPVRVNGLIWDITEHKRAEEEKAKLEAELQQAQKLEAIGTLAGGIAHDFNNILQPMMGYAEMALRELSPSDPVRDDLEQILVASQRAKELIRQILAISRSTQEQQRIPIDISSIIKEALKLLRSTLPTSIEMRQKILKGVAMAEPTQIHQVLMNLCTNAAHAMADKGVLEVRLSPVDLSESDLADQHIVDLKPGPHLKLSVSDTGAGIDAKTMEHIFDPYFTTKEVGKGSGLGLAVVHGIVKRHEGAITVQSEPGKGTTFTIYIPKVDVKLESTMQVDYPLPRGSERILLVDDEPTVMEMATSILKRLGYKVTSRTDSVDALEVFHSNPDEFDLLITDYTMPKLTGVDFAREVRRIRPDMPILLCTGFSEKITHESAKELGVVLLMKPYGMRQISVEVRKILDARKGGRFGEGN